MPHNNEGVPNRIYKEFRKRSSKRSSYIFSNFEQFKTWKQFKNTLNIDVDIDNVCPFEKERSGLRSPDLGRGIM